MYPILFLIVSLLGSSILMIGYAWIKKIKNDRLQDANAGPDEASNEETQPSSEIIKEYPHLVRKTA